MRRAPRGTRELVLQGAIERIALSAEFDRALAAVKRRWPAAPVDDEAFASYVHAHLDGEDELLARLPRLRIDELFLVWWAMSAPAGVAAFLATYGEGFAHTLACVTTRFGRIETRPLLDRLMIELFGDEPRVLEYSGFGSLGAWLDVVATQWLLEAAHAATPV